MDNSGSSSCGVNLVEQHESESGWMNLKWKAPDSNRNVENDCNKEEHLNKHNAPFLQRYNGKIIAIQQSKNKRKRRRERKLM